MVADICREMEWSVFAVPYLGVAVVSDAWGCSAFMPATGDWFQFAWPPAWHEASIAAKELLPILISVAIWGKSWMIASVEFVCDNLAVVQVLNLRLVHDPLPADAPAEVFIFSRLSSSLNMWPSILLAKTMWQLMLCQGIL